MDVAVVLWFQFGYAIWQFVRVAKFCRLPYAVLAHTFMWVIGRWGRPFAIRNYLVLDPPRQKYYMSTDVLVSTIDPWIYKKKSGSRDCVLDPPSATFQRLSVHDTEVGLDYHLCSRNLAASFVWNYLRDDPDCFARSADLIFPTFEILDRVSFLDGLKKICQGEYVPVSRRGRFLAVPDREKELNQNFMRMLATVPLMAQAKGYDTQSVWISLTIIAIDQLSLLFNYLWKRFQELLLHTFHLLMVRSSFQPLTRQTICTFFSTMGDRMMYSDEVRLNFIQVKKGDLVYTMSPFNCADFGEIVERVPSFERKRKVPVPYSEAEFGVYEQANGDSWPGFPEDGTPIISHFVQGSRIDSMFLEDGIFLNFINNQHLHFGVWEGDDDKENFQDLLQVMEESQMLPLLQTDGGLFKSLKFNSFLTPGNSIQDLTFLKVKRNAMIGGKM